MSGLPAELRQRLQDYQAPFREWPTDAATTPLIHGNRDLDSWQPFIDRFCAYAFFWHFHGAYHPDIEASTALCDLIYTVMGWLDDEEVEQQKAGRPEIDEGVPFPGPDRGFLRGHRGARCLSVAADAEVDQSSEGDGVQVVGGRRREIFSLFETVGCEDVQVEAAEF